MSAQTTATAKRNWTDIAKGFGALIGVFALAVGVPIALIAWVGWPLPEEMTSIDQITGALRDRYIPDAFLIKALAVVCWLVWIELMASLIVEAVAYLRGRQAGRVPLAGGAQRAAARQEAFDKTLVDDGDFLALRRVGAREFAAQQERHAPRGKRAGPYPIVTDVRILPFLFDRAFHHHIASAVVTGQQ